MGEDGSEAVYSTLVTKYMMCGAEKRLAGDTIVVVVEHPARGGRTAACNVPI